MKHRICKACWGALAQRGYVSNHGRELTERLQVCSGTCGLVQMGGRERPPPQKKLDLVKKIPAGAVKLLATEAPKTLRHRARGKWVNLEKNDLARLSTLVPVTRPRLRLVGPAVSGAIPMVSLGSDYNRCKALMCRMFAHPPGPRQGIWRWAARFKSFLFSEYESPPEEMTTAEWIASLPAIRRVALTDAMELYSQSGWSKKYEDFHSFVKAELLPDFGKEGIELVPLRAMVDRLINAPHDVTHCIAGPKIKPYMAWLKKQWSVDSSLFYGGVNPEDLLRWLRRATSQPRFAFWSDYSMFDSSHNEDTWEYVEHFYRQYAGDKDFQKVLRAWRAPKGTLGNLRYRGRTMNASGRDDTALANALLNGTAMYLSVTAAWYRIEVTEVELKHVQGISDVLLLSVCGDDALGFLPLLELPEMKQFCETVRKNLALFGFKSKFYASLQFEDCVYLGHRPVRVGGEWYWARTIGRCLYKLGWQLEPRGDPRAHFAGICQMHDICSGHVPIISDICRTWLKVSQGCKVNSWKPDPDKPWEEMGRTAPKCYDYDTLESIARAYSVGNTSLREDLEGFEPRVLHPQDILDAIHHCVEVVGSSGGRPCVLDHWVLRHMVLVDEQ